MRALFLVACCALSVSACASEGGGIQMPKAFAGKDQATQAPPETFRYGSAADGHVRVTIDSITMHGDHGFMPTDPNWLQAHVTFANVGREPVMFLEMKAKLADSTVVAGTTSAYDVRKPPSASKMMLQTGGIQAVGMAAGYLLFPLAGLAVGAASMLPMINGERSAQYTETVQKSTMQPETLQPGDRTAGNVFVPAVTGQTALVVSYAVGGSTRSVTIPREQ